jgi:hypothetical protein
MPNPGFNPGFTSLLFNKGGGEPRIKPGVWRPEMWAQLIKTMPEHPVAKKIKIFGWNIIYMCKLM